MAEKEKAKTKQKQYNKGKISVCIDKDTWDKLNELKIHPRQTYAELIAGLVNKGAGKK